MKNKLKYIYLSIVATLIFVFTFTLVNTKTYAYTYNNNTGEFNWNWQKQQFTTSNSKINRVNVNITYTDYTASPIEQVESPIYNINIQLSDTNNNNNIYTIGLDLKSIPNVTYQEINGIPRLIYNNNVNYIIDEISLETTGDSFIALNYIRQSSVQIVNYIYNYKLYNNFNLNLNTTSTKINDSLLQDTLVNKIDNKTYYIMNDNPSKMWRENERCKFSIDITTNQSMLLLNNAEVYDEGIKQLGEIYCEISTGNIRSFLSNNFIYNNWYNETKYNELLQQYNQLQQNYNDLQIKYQTSLYPIMFGDFAYIDNINYYDSTYNYTKNLAFLVNNNYLQNNGELLITQLMKNTVNENFNTQTNYVEINFIENLINAKNMYYNFIDRESSSVTFAFNVNGQVRICNIGNNDNIDYQTIKTLLSLNDEDIVYLKTILIDNVSYTSDMYDFVIKSNPYDLVSYNNGLQAGLQSASQEFEKQKQALLNEISLLNDDIQNLNAQITNRDASISYYQGLISNYQTRITSLENNINTLTSAYNSLNESYQNTLNGNNFVSLFFTIAETPFTAFKSIWNVDFLGVNLAGFVTGILFIGIIIWLIKKVF